MKQAPSSPATDTAVDARAEPSLRPLVVMFVANPFVYDTRVEKQARTLIDWGLRVRVCCRSDGEQPAFEERDGIEIERLPLSRSDFVRALAFAVVLPPAKWLRRWLEREPASREPAAEKNAARAPARPAPAPLWMKVLARFFPPSAPRLAYCIGFARSAVRLQPTVVVAHDLDTLLAAVLVSHAHGTPVLYDSHELYVERNVGRSPRWKERLFWGFLERRLITRARWVTTVAGGIADDLATRYAIDRPTLIRNVQRFEEAPGHTGDLHEKVGVPTQTKLVIYAGALTFNRGLEQMVEAAPRLEPGVAFVVMGYAHDPTYLDALRRAAEANRSLDRQIHFTPAVPSAEVVRFVSGATLGIVPTQAACRSYEYEASNKIFHCVMAGVPLVLSDHVEKRALVEEWGIGVLFDERDPGAMAAAVNDLVANEARREELAANCLRAARTLNWEQEEQRYREIFRALAPEAMPQLAVVRGSDPAPDPGA